MITSKHGFASGKSLGLPFDVEVSPLSQIKIRASHPRGTSAEVTIESPPPGQVIEVVIPMQIVSRPRLFVTVEGASAAGLKQLAFCFQTADSPESHFLSVSPTEQVDTYIIASVPLDPRVYDVTLTSLNRFGPAQFLMPQWRSVELPEGGDVRIEFPLVMGGRCDVTVTSPLTSGWSAQLQLEDTAGVARQTRSLQHGSSSAGGDFTSSSSTVFSSSGTADRAASAANSRGLLPPGQYTLTVTSKEHKPLTQTVEVLAGKTKKLSVTLEPR